jgi:phosphoserine aminotransferase
MKPLNFFSGPAILPDVVLQKTQAAIENFDNTGLSILEISHRHKAFVNLFEETRHRLKLLMALDDDFEVLLLQGGASLQFCMVPLNVAAADDLTAYHVTGNWAKLASKEAARLTKMTVAASSDAENFSHIPKQLSVAENTRYLHITTNNTIYGTQIQHVDFALNTAASFVVADMSSDILSMPRDYNRFGLIYAGAQKNLGAAGVTMVVVRNSLLGKTNRDIPAMLNYQTHISKDSMHNTPTVIAVYVMYEMLQWLEREGLENIFSLNEMKAHKLYQYLDQSTMFKGTVAKEDRSMMNVCFVCNDASHEKRFSDFAKQHNIIGIEGHRSVGGFRASLYNALPMSHVNTLIDVMKDFERDS